MRTVTRFAIWLVVGLVVAGLTGIAAMFLYFSPVIPWTWVRVTLAIALLVLVPVLFIMLRPRWKALVATAFLLAGLILWFALIPARQDRAWRPQVARLARAQQDGDQLTVTNVRNFRYRDVDDFEESWETRTYDLATLSTLDMSFTYWGSENMAHTMLSFGFRSGDQLAVSVEVRREEGESFAPIASAFKRFEIIYVLADERDVFALRTNVLNETMYLFPIDVPPGQIRLLLEDILARVNRLAERPAWYRPIRDNCTTSLAHHMDRTILDTPWSYRLSRIINGQLPKIAYDMRALPDDGNSGFEATRRRYLINDKARAYGDGPAFSRVIRADRAAPVVPRHLRHPSSDSR